MVVTATREQTTQLGEMHRVLAVDEGAPAAGQPRGGAAYNYAPPR